MGFLKRLVGGPTSPAPAGDEPTEDRPHAAPDTASATSDEAARDKELLLEEARRLDNDLIQRQLRYADRSWTPPAQGGSRRADDEEAKRETAT